MANEMKVPRGCIQTEQIPAEERLASQMVDWETQPGQSALLDQLWIGSLQTGLIDLFRFLVGWHLDLVKRPI
jgi:hypothetical protein